MQDILRDQPEGSYTDRSTTAMVGIAQDVWSGVKDEVLHHPLELVKDGLVGAGVAALATALAPEVGLVAAGIGIGLAAEHVWNKFGEWSHAESVLENKDNESPDQVARAHQTFHDFGRGVADTLAGAVGAGFILRGVSTAAESAESEIPPAAQANPPLDRDLRPVAPFGSPNFSTVPTTPAGWRTRGSAPVFSTSSSNAPAAGAAMANSSNMFAGSASNRVFGAPIRVPRYLEPVVDRSV